MKVLLINGSPHKNGATNRALLEIEGELLKNDIEVEKIWLGNDEMSGCISCGFCYKNKRCFRDDLVNEVGSKLDLYDGIIVGSPVHYASASGFLTSFLDRLFYVYGAKMKGKVYASIASARRAGTTATLDQLYKYGYIAGMVMVGGQYWNVIHGNDALEAEHDLEGLQIMRTLGRNIAWIIKCIVLGKENGLKYPEREASKRTNFIRNEG